MCILCLSYKSAYLVKRQLSFFPTSKRLCLRQMCLVMRTLQIQTRTKQFGGIFRPAEVMIVQRLSDKKQLMFVLRENIPMADTPVEQTSQCETQVSPGCLTDKLEKKCFGGWKLNVFYKLASSVHVGTEADMAEKLLLPLLLFL